MLHLPFDHLGPNRLDDHHELLQSPNELSLVTNWIDLSDTFNTNYRALETLFYFRVETGKDIVLIDNGQDSSFGSVP